MPKFGRGSLKVRDTLHPDLQRLVDEAIKYFDFSLICGYRNKVGQTKAYKSGHSKTPWPQSKHNKLPAHAFDFQPWPDGKDQDYIFLAGQFIGIARQLLAEGYIQSNVRYGGDFNRNDKVSDDGWDWGHIEID